MLQNSVKKLFDHQKVSFSLLQFFIISRYQQLFSLNSKLYTQKYIYVKLT